MIFIPDGSVIVTSKLGAVVPITWLNIGELIVIEGASISFLTTISTHLIFPAELLAKNVIKTYPSSHLPQTVWSIIPVVLLNITFFPTFNVYHVVFKFGSIIKSSKLGGLFPNN